MKEFPVGDVSGSSVKMEEFKTGEPLISGYVTAASSDIN